MYYSGAGLREKTEATTFSTWEEAQKVRSIMPTTLRARVVLTGVGYLIRVSYLPLARYVAFDKDGPHTTRRDHAHIFETKDAAESAMAPYRNIGSNPVLEWVGLKLPDWLVEGARVCIPEGPMWKIVRINGTEINLVQEDDDHPVVWGIDRFLAIWEPVRMNRFNREDPI